MHLLRSKIYVNLASMYPMIILCSVIGRLKGGPSDYLDENFTNILKNHRYTPKAF